MHTDNDADRRRFLEAVLFDRDGTLVEDRHYPSSPGQITLLPGVAQALARLERTGVRLFTVSNQSGVGRGYFDRGAVHACNARLAELLAEHGVRLTEMLFCPHDPKDGCSCRKPATGMWEELRARCGLRAEMSAMVGDKLEDIRFGHAFRAAASVLVLTGKGKETARAWGLSIPDAGFRALTLPGYPHAVAANMEAAVDFLLQGARGVIT